MKKNNNIIQISIFGLGYVGLPLAIEFSKKYKVFGFDINKKRINDLKNKIDINNELNTSQIKNLKRIEFTNNIREISSCNVHIVAVPTPINKKNLPNLSNLKFACINIAKILKKNDTIIFESTVYPGLTEEYCVPIIEKYSNFLYNKDFFCGYSPERINPGDQLHKFSNIRKVVSGSTPKTLERVAKLYESVIEVGVHRASSIKVAEASKVVENAHLRVFLRE